MFELTMTTNSRDQRPTITSEKLKDISNLHSSHMIGESIENQKPYNVRVDAAARIHSSIAARIILRNRLPPLASNDLFGVAGSSCRH